MPFRPAVNIAVLALVATLTACHPVETWRSITGNDKDDPDPQTTPNSQNLAAGEQQPYPNLATVPSPPVPTMTQVERDKLTESLVADRTNAKYNEQKLLPGFSTSGEAPPPPPSSGGAPPSAGASRPPNGPPPGAATPAGPAAPSASAKSSPPSARKPGEPPQPGPKESSLQSPTIKESPLPEVTQPPPPPPSPTMAPSPTPAASAVAPTAMASAAPQPPPPPPPIASIAAPPPPPSLPTPASAEPKSAGRTVATIDFSAALANFTQTDRAAIDKVAAQYHQKPGLVHIVAYAAAAPGGKEQLDAYRAALERGQAVARALAGDGVPVGKIQTEAAPTRAGSPSGRVVIQLAP
ncbi:MAG TPA: hypothetical protein VHW66_20665 [Stellaceae bacterium]|nr:hypothetical protein [Stellaceae bacterium]